jgi:hypothetical protein
MLRLSIQFMTKEEDKVLSHPETCQPYNEDLFRKEMNCIGHHISPKTFFLEHCKSAVTKLHSFFKSTPRGAYRDGECRACIALKAKAVEKKERPIS